MHFGIRINPLECGSVVVLNSSISVVVSRQLYCYVFSLKVFRIITDWNVMKWNKMFWLKTWNTSQLHWNPRIQKIASTCLAVATDQEIAMAIEMDSLTDRNQRKILLSLYLPRLWQWWSAIPCTLLSLDICAACFPQCWSSNLSIYRIVYTYVQLYFWNYLLHTVKLYNPRLNI